jgi:hypothetical protein
LNLIYYLFRMIKKFFFFVIFRGGPILVPILIMGFNYNATKSVSIAFIIMFAGSLANYVSNCKSKTKEG